MSSSLAQRPHSVSSVSNLPVIHHPMANVCSKKNLNVVGMNRRNLSSAGSLRIGLDSGSGQGLSQMMNLPSLKERRHARNPTWPAAQSRSSSADLPTRKRIDPQKLYKLVKDHLSSHFNVFEQQFKANDPMGRGVVSKGAFSRVLYHLVGYVSLEDIGRFLQWLNIDSSNGISFNKFVSAFPNDKGRSRRWVTPFHHQGSSGDQKRPFPEEHLRKRVLHRDQEYITASYANAVLKEKCKHRDFDLHDHLATSCFEPGAHILAPQLSECLSSIGFPLDSEEMDILWSRYDLQNTGALDAAWFFERIGLDRFGCHLPRARTAPPRTSRSWGIQAEDKSDEIDQTPTRGQSRSPPRHNRIHTAEQARPPSSDVISSLMRKMEQNYYSLLISCQRVDDTNNGLITKAALMGVLKEYGILLHPFDMEELLERCHLLRKDHYVSYQDFLYKFMVRSSQGVAHRVMTDPVHCFNNRTNTPAGNLSAEEAEAKLVELFHKDFLKLLGTFKSLDPHSLHLTTQLQFREAINKVFNMRITDNQFKELLQEVGTTEDGLVPYPEFLAIFNKKRYIPSNLDSNNPRRSPSAMEISDPPLCALSPQPEPMLTSRVQTPPQRKQSSPEGMAAEIVTERGDNDMSKKKCMMEGRYRPVYKIARIVQDQLNCKRLVAKEAFERLDVKNTGRISRTQLHYWLQALDVVLHPTELQNLWGALETGSDGLVHQGELLEFFTNEDRRKHYIDNQAVLRKARATYNDLPSYHNGILRSKVIRSQEELKPQRNSLGSPNLDILRKIRPQIVDHWDELKEILRQSDPEGYGTISIQEFKNVCHFMKLDLSDHQLSKLCDQFDFDKNDSFHYLQFMQMFAPSSLPVGKSRDQDLRYNKDTHRIIYEGPSGAVQESVSTVLNKIGCQLMKEFKNLRRAFKKADLNKDGYLSVVEFKACVKKIIRNISDDDLFHVLSELDANMDGKISYDEFLAHLQNL